MGRKNPLSALRRSRRLPKATIEKGGSIESLLRCAELSVIDVGARGSTRSEWKLLVPFSRLLASEPDSTEAERLEHELSRAGWREVTVIHEAIAARDGTSTLVVTSRPGMSSLLRPNRQVADQYFNASSFETVRSLPVRTITLDRAADEHGFSDSTLIKLDTQGTELEILRSGSRLVQGALMGVFLEVSFHPFYVGQSLFADVDTFLRENGFGLVELRPTHLRRRGFDQELFSRRQTVWAHCLYLRDPLEVAKRDSVTLLARYLSVALAYEQFDLVLELVRLPHVSEALAGCCGSGLEAELRSFVAASTRRKLRRAPKGDRKALLAPFSRLTP